MNQASDLNTTGQVKPAPKVDFFAETCPTDPAELAQCDSCQ